MTFLLHNINKQIAKHLYQKHVFSRSLPMNSCHHPWSICQTTVFLVADQHYLKFLLKFSSAQLQQWLRLSQNTVINIVLITIGLSLSWELFLRFLKIVHDYLCGALSDLIRPEQYGFMSGRSKRKVACNLSDILNFITPFVRNRGQVDAIYFHLQ